MRIIPWNEETAQRKLKQRLTAAKDYRQLFERNWIQTEETVFTSLGRTRSLSSSIVGDLSAVYGTGQEEINDSNTESNSARASRNLRLIHSQLSANPPSVVIRPTSSDPEDRMKADAADRVVRHAIRAYNMQEKQDACSLNTLAYGTGFTKAIFNGDIGDILEIDEETGEMVMEGDIEITVPSTWDVWLDSDAECWEEVKYVFQRIYMDFDEACARFPDKKDLLEKAGASGNKRSGVDSSKQDSEQVEIYEYWEKGLPINGYLGRHGYCMADGQLLAPLKANPHKFMSTEAARRLRDEGLEGDELEEALTKIPQIAELPFHIFTDIDLPNTVYGKSTTEYANHIQDNINRLDMMTIDNIRAHGISRMVLPEGSEVSDDSITDSTWDIVKLSGSVPPHFVNPPSPMQDMSPMRDRLQKNLDDTYGVNDTMFGQMQRETSGSALQYATNQGNMIRRRLFNKYVLLTESVYKTYLKLVRKHWDVGKVIQVVGREKIVEAVEIKGADIDGGFDMQVEYGASLSLDPQTRRQEIMTMQPLFEKANVPPRIQLQMMKLNELEGMYDIIQMAEDRQKEIFDIMLATGEYITPEKFQDHQNMIAYALQYFMTREFADLDPEFQEMCRQHVEDRRQVAAQEMQPPSGMPPGPAPAMQPAAPPATGPAGGPTGPIPQI